MSVRGVILLSLLLAVAAESQALDKFWTDPSGTFNDGATGATLAMGG